MLFVDHVGVGVGPSHRVYAEHEPSADWVWILDDDDECIYPILDDIRRIQAEHPTADVIMVRMDHGPAMGILPDWCVWEKEPVHGHLGISSYIVKSAVFRQHREAWMRLRYQSDYDFINAVFNAGHEVVWHDVVASRVQRISHGAPELEYAVAPTGERAVTR